MSHISTSKDITLSVEFNGQTIEGLHTINYYDDDTLACAELDYDLESYSIELSDDDKDTLSELISGYIYTSYSRGLDSITDGETIYLINKQGILVKG